MLKDMADMSNDLYRISRDISLIVKGDYFIVKYDSQNDKQMSVWLDGGKLIPQVDHNFLGHDRIDSDELIAILEVFKKYNK